MKRIRELCKTFTPDTVARSLRELRASKAIVLELTDCYYRVQNDD